MVNEAVLHLQDFNWIRSQVQWLTCEQKLLSVEDNKCVKTANNLLFVLQFFKIKILKSNKHNYLTTINYINLKQALNKCTYTTAMWSQYFSLSCNLKRTRRKTQKYFIEKKNYMNFKKINLKFSKGISQIACGLAHNEK